MTMLWKPTKEYKNNSNMQQFIDAVSQKYQLRDNNYSTIHDWSITNTSDFWMEVWNFCKIQSSESPTEVVDDSKKCPEHVGLRMQS